MFDWQGLKEIFAVFISIGKEFAYPALDIS